MPLPAENQMRVHYTEGCKHRAKKKPQDFMYIYFYNYWCEADPPQSGMKNKDLDAARMWDLCYTFLPSKQPAQSSRTWAAPTFSVAAGTKRLSHLMWGTQQPRRNNGKVFFFLSFLVVKGKKNLFTMKLNWLSVLLGSLCSHTYTVGWFFFLNHQTCWLH